MKHPLRTILCNESPYDLINVLGPFLVILQPRNFYKVEFTNTVSARKTARRITKILRSSGYSQEIESFKSMKYSSCHEFSNLGAFCGSPGIPVSYLGMK